VMYEQVEEREEDREGLLHAQKTVEGPFAVILNYFLAFGNSFLRDYVLAGVVAFGKAVPEEKAMVKGCIG
jgi:hypothetical protein